MTIWQYLGLSAFMSSEALIFHNCTLMTREYCMSVSFLKPRFYHSDGKVLGLSAAVQSIEQLDLHTLVETILSTSVWVLSKAEREHIDYSAVWEELLRYWISYSQGGIFGGSLQFALYLLRNADSVPSNIVVSQSLVVGWKAVWFCCSILTSSVTQEVFHLGLWSLFADEL